MINSFQILNLRSIEDSGAIDLRRVTVLVGRNSSGKSTLLRTLPLLRQSVEQATKGPILWYGRLVDFGDFKNAARNGDAARGVTLKFGLAVTPKRRTTAKQNALEGDLWFSHRQPLRGSLELTIGRSSDDRVGHIRRMVITIQNDDVVVDFDGRGDIKDISVMGESVDLGEGYEWYVRPGKLVPGVSLLERTVYQVDEDDYEEDYSFVERPFSSLVEAKMRYLAHANTSDERIRSICDRLGYAGEVAFYQQLRSLAGLPSALEHRLEQLSARSYEVRALRRAVLLRRMDGLLRAVDEEMDKFARSVRYIEPIRASAERYYREQDLAVDDIDSRGTNTAVFLSSLNEHSLRGLQSWMKSNFGFLVSVETGTGHIQVKISDGVSTPRNIADLGFGYSQLLPIILQLWRSSQHMGGDVYPVLAVEQPELHLHPHYQALLADVVVAAASGRRSAILIETHSDHFVNRLGALVAEKRVSPSDVQVVVVSEDESGSATAKIVEFDDEGTLSSNWPVGFFTPGVV